MVEQGDLANPRMPLLFDRISINSTSQVMVSEQNIIQAKARMQVKVVIKPCKEITEQLQKSTQSAEYTGNQYIVKTNYANPHLNYCQNVYVNARFL